MTSGAEALIELRDVMKTYKMGSEGYTALKHIDLDVNAGEFVAVIGKSGSGKSTLINMITGIDRPTSGEVLVGDTLVHKLNEDQTAQWRGRNVGIVFQFFQLLPTLTVIENVMLPMDFCRMFPPKERKERALRLLSMVEMEDQANKLPSTLSGGQQQRAAIARALANDPPVLLADEPTGNLDSKMADVVFNLFIDLARNGKTVVMVTHDSSLARRAARTVLLADGEVVNEYVAKALPTLTAGQMLHATHNLQPLTFAPGATILREGQASDSFFIVTAGQVEVALKHPGGSDVVVACYGPGQYFGEIEAVRGGKNIATIRAAEHTGVEAVALDRETFTHLLEESEETQRVIDQVIRARVAENKATRGGTE